MTDPYVTIPPNHVVVIKLPEGTDQETMDCIGQVWKQATGRAPLAILGDITVSALIDTRCYATRKASK